MTGMDTHESEEQAASPQGPAISGQPSTGGSFSTGVPNWMPTGWAWLRCRRTGCPSIYWVAPMDRLFAWETRVCSPECAQLVSAKTVRISPPDPRGPVVPPRTVV